MNADNSDVLWYVREHPGSTAEEIDAALDIADAEVRLRLMLAAEVDQEDRHGRVVYVAKPWHAPPREVVESVYRQIAERPGITDSEVFTHPRSFVWEALDTLTRGDTPRVRKEWDGAVGWRFTAVEESV